MVTAIWPAPRRVALLAGVLFALNAGGASAITSAERLPVYRPPLPPGAKTLRFRTGPIRVQPGQNLIRLRAVDQRPKVDGWIVGFRPDMVRADGSRPPAEEVMLHHGVWLVDMNPTFAAGEEKSRVSVPRGFGWRYTTEQSWLLNDMIHSLVPGKDTVYITWEIDFIPDSSPAASRIKPVTTKWMDVQGLKPYPVFNALRGDGGSDGRFTYPDEAIEPYPDGRIRNRWVVDRDATLVATVGHLHPGGLWTDLELTRDGRTVNLFRSRAAYWDRRGPVSLDFAMTATSPDWRIAVKKGDVLSTSATYDTRSASWYEVMGIMPVAITDKPSGGINPFVRRPRSSGSLTHGRLRENIDSGGRRSSAFNDPRALSAGPSASTVRIDDFHFDKGDLAAWGAAARPPTVAFGQPLTFVNEDRPTSVRFHTITGCRLPCDRSPGVSFPLANGATFDSGELGFGPVVPWGGERVPFTAALNTATWSTPPTLRPGTYAYFCRIHPFMRGAFRVQPAP